MNRILIPLSLLPFTLLCSCKPQQQAPIDSDLAANMAAPYDYYMNGVRTTRFGADGELAFRLNASRVTHYPEGDHAVLENPDLFWQDEGQKPWHLTSLMGDLHKTAEGNEDELFLEGNVRLNLELEPGQPLEVVTETLIVQTVARTANTPSPVSVNTPGSSLQGVGMEVRMEDNYVHLLNEVRGSYEP